MSTRTLTHSPLSSMVAHPCCPLQRDLLDYVFQPALFEHQIDVKALPQDT